MKAIQVMNYGGSDELALADVAIPEPGEGEALVRMGMAGVNFIDVYMRTGIFKRSVTYENAPPFTPGMEGAGIIEKVGPGVDNVTAGDQVAYCLNLGSYAEFAAVPAWKLVKVPDGIPLDIATALQLQGSTAHYLTHSLYPLKEGDSCLVHAGAGGLGQLVIQLAKARGAVVYTTVGSAEKAEIAKARGAAPTTCSGSTGRTRSPSPSTASFRWWTPRRPMTPSKAGKPRASCCWRRRRTRDRSRKRGREAVNCRNEPAMKTLLTPLRLLFTLSRFRVWCALTYSQALRRAFIFVPAFRPRPIFFASLLRVAA